MSGTNVTINSTKGMSTLVRPRFGPGMLLQHEDLEQLNVYTRELNRIMFRSLFGCGVVCGLVVTTEQKCGQGRITVGAGLALTCEGDPIYVPKDQSVVIDEKCDPNLKSPLWVILCGAVKCCAPRTSMCPSDDEETTSVCTREREGWEIRVVSEEPKCVCRCKSDVDVVFKDTTCKCVDPDLPCYKDHYDGKCSCECHDCNGSCCDCVLLARLKRPDLMKPDWIADHRVRRFVRPVLMRDPRVEYEREATESKAQKQLQVEQLTVQLKELERVTAELQLLRTQAALDPDPQPKPEPGATAPVPPPPTPKGTRRASKGPSERSDV